MIQAFPGRRVEDHGKPLRRPDQGPNDNHDMAFRMARKRTGCRELALMAIWAAFVAPVPALAERCATFLPMLEKSRCAQQSEGLFWKNEPDHPEILTLPADAWDEQLTDPALLRAVRTTGNAEFTFSAKGWYVVEVFLTERAARPSSFVLWAGGQQADTRNEILPGPERLMPGGRTRIFSLVASIQGPTTLRVATNSAGWALAGVRWTERQEFETFRVAPLRRQLKKRLLEPFFGIGERGASLRASHLEELGLRLEESRNMAARREGLHAQARAMYWRAAENHQRARSLARESSLRSCFASCRTTKRCGRWPRPDACARTVRAK